MKIKKLLCKRIVAAVLLMCIVLASINAAFFISAADEPTVLDNTEPSWELNTSLIYGMKPLSADIYDNGTTVSVITHPNIKNFTNGNVSDCLDYVNGKYGFFLDSSRNLKSNVYDDIVYQLDADGNACEIEEIFLSGHSSKALAIYQYQIYAADTIEGLRDSGAMLLEHTNANGAQKQLIKLNKKVTAKYIMLRVTAGVVPPATDYGVDSCYARIAEIAVSGKSLNTITVKDNTEPSEQLSDSLIYNTVPLTAQISDNGTNSNILGSPKIGVLTDGAMTANLDMVNGSYGIFVDSNRKLRENVYVDLIWQLDSTGMACEIDKFFISHCKNYDLATYKYQIYAADTLDELSKSGAMLLNYTNESGTFKQLIELNEPVTAKYVMLRITAGVRPNSTAWGLESCYARVNEFAVFGSRAIPAYTVYNDTLPDAGLESSLIYGTKPVSADITDNGTVKSYMTHPKLGNLTDAVKNNSIDVVYGEYGIFKDSGKNLRDNVYDDFIYQLDSAGAACRIDEIFIGHCENSELATYKYQIYAADTLEDLKKSESLVIDYTNSTGKYTQLIKFSQPFTAKYIMFRITAGVQPITSSFSWNSCYARISEFAVMGTRGTADVEIKSGTDPSKALSESAIYGSSPYSIYAWDSGETYNMITNPDRVKLTDGAASGMMFTWEGTIGKFKNPDGTLRNQNELEVYTDVVYQVGLDSSPVKVNEIYLQFPEGQLSANHYQVFVANTVAGLGTDSSLVADVTNSSAAGKQLITLNKEVKGSYVMIRVLMGVQPNAGYGYDLLYTRIQEIAVYTESAAEYTLEVISPPSDNSYFDQYGESLIKNKTATLKYNGVNMGANIQMTDGNYLVHKDYSSYLDEYMNPNGDYLDLVYRLGEDPYELDSMIFSGCPRTPNGYWTGRYKVYMATDIEDLFLEENCVYEYNYRVAGVSAIQRIVWNEDSKPVGCFVAIRILESTNKKMDWGYLRMAEFAVFGNKAVIPTTPINMAENMPIEAYTIDSNGKMNQLDLNREMISALTDNDASTTASFNADNKRLDLVYNLCQNGRVYGYSLIPNNTSGYIKGLKIYASEDLNALWEETALVYENKDEGETGDTLTEYINARYIRFSIPANSGKNIKIAEIVINGLSDQRLKNRNIMPNVEDEANIFEYTYSSGEVDFIKVDSKYLQMLFDNDKELSPTIYGGESGKSSLNYLVSLGELKNISDINIWFDSMSDIWLPEKAKIYIGETWEEVTGENRKAVKEFNAVPDENGWKVELVPTLARYVCISIEKMNDSYYIDDTMAPIITEIEVFATNVKGMNTSDDNDALYTFSDAKTGIKWEIVRRDITDILTTVYSSKIIKSDITDTQVNGIAKKGYKAEGTSINSIEFYDRVGNKITDIGERTVRIYYPAVEGVDPLTTLLYSVSGSEVSAENSALSEDGNYMFVELTDLSKLNLVLALYTGEYYTEPEEPENSGNDSADDSAISDVPFNPGSSSTVIDDTSINISDDGDETETVIKKHKTVKKVKKNNSDEGDFNMLFVIIPIAAVLVLGAAAAAFIIVKRKKRGGDKA